MQREEGHIGAIQDTLLTVYSDATQARATFREVVRQLAPLRALVKLDRVAFHDPACPHRTKAQRREVVENAAWQNWILDREGEEKELRREVRPPAPRRDGSEDVEQRW